MRECGLAISMTDIKQIMSVNGDKVSFYSFLSMFDFNMDAVVRYEYDFENERYIKMYKQENIKHIKKISDTGVNVTTNEDLKGN